MMSTTETRYRPEGGGGSEGRLTLWAKYAANGFATAPADWKVHRCGAEKYQPLFSISTASTLQLPRASVRLEADRVFSDGE